MTDRPHPEGFPEEPLVRLAHDSLAVRWGTTASYHLSAPRLEKVGFADIPFLTVEVICKSQDLGSMIPVCRQAAFAYIGERGVSSDHLAFRPSVSTGSRRTRFADQHGKKKMGERHDVRFELSKMLTGAVQWSGRQGVLQAGWEL